MGDFGLGRFANRLYVVRRPCVVGRWGPGWPVTLGHLPNPLSNRMRDAVMRSWAVALASSLRDVVEDVDEVAAVVGSREDFVGECLGRGLMVSVGLLWS